jgi:hypothetical protein
MKNIAFQISEPYLCVATLLQIIIKTDCNIDIDQKEIGNFFGIYVPNDYSGNLVNVIKTDDMNKWGVIISNNEINDFFIKYELPLREKYIPINMYEDWNFEEEITKSLIENKYLICGFDYGFLFEKYKANSIGHVVLILKILGDYNHRIIKIYDPGPNNAGIKAVNSIDLFYAIHLKKNGIWMISHI